jgi:hypothetical protein
MMNGYILALVDPRDHRIFHVEWVTCGVRVNEHVADIVADAKSGKTTPFLDQVRGILTADYNAPHVAILQLEATEVDEVAWARLLAEVGNELTHLDRVAGFVPA